MAVRHEHKGPGVVWTHVDWALSGVAANMIDWYWANMDKGFILWHPTQHKEFYWDVAPTPEKFLGAIHVAPQQWKDGRFIKPRLQFKDVTTLRQDIADLIVYDHVIVVSPPKIDPIVMNIPPENPADPYYNYRLHQWQKTDDGVIGMSSAVSNIPIDEAHAEVWAAHASEEVGNWGVSLPTLYKLYSIVPESSVNLYVSLKVQRDGKNVTYVNLK